jgi:ribonuclease HII
MTAITTPTAREVTARRRRRVPVPGIRHERPHWDAGAIVAGVDEVGRGAWAGPVTYAAVVLPRDRRMYKLRDSKVLPPPERERLADRLHGFALAVGIGHAGNDEIDRLGMSEAMRRAARRAVDALPLRPDVLLLDGNWDFLAGYGTHNERIVRGDGRSASIAAASIVAKVARDRLMVEADPGYPAYAFASNKGYPAPDHVAALDRFGPCPLHRRSWAPIAGLDQLTLFGDELDG